MNEQLKILDVVAGTEDIPNPALHKGQVGTIVEILQDGIYDVEFSDANGCTYALASLGSDQLLRLLHDPVETA